MKQQIIYFGALAKLGGFIAINFPSFTSLLILKEFEISQIEFNLLFTVITFPNAFLPFIFGSLTKYMKPRTFMLLMIFAIFLGQTLCSLAVVYKQFYLLVVGRLFVGLGHVNSNQPKSQLVTHLYPKNNAFYFQIFPTIGRLGVFASAMYFAQFQVLTKETTLMKPTVLVWALTFLSFLCGVQMYRLDKFLEDKEFQKLEQLKNQYEMNPDLSFMSEDTQDALSRKSSAYESKNKQENKQNQKGILEILKTELSIEYYIILIISAIGLTLYFPLINNCQIIFKEKFNLTGPITVYLQILPPLLSSILGLGFGKLMDRYGKRLYFCIFCGLLALNTNSITVFIQKYFLINNNILFAFLYMMSLGFYESIFQLIELPCLSIIVPEQYLGFASGLDLAVQNNVLSFSGILMGHLISPSYFYSNRFLQFDTLLFLSSVTFMVLCLILLFVDTKYFGSRLQVNYQEQQEREDNAVNKNQNQNILFDLELQQQQEKTNDNNNNYNNNVIGFQEFNDEKEEDIENQQKKTNKNLFQNSTIKKQLEQLQHVLDFIKN